MSLARPRRSLTVTSPPFLRFTSAPPSPRPNFPVQRTARTAVPPLTSAVRRSFQPAAYFNEEGDDDAVNDVQALEPGYSRGSWPPWWGRFRRHGPPTTRSS